METTDCNWKLKLPIGYRFCPTDQELLENYLLPKVKGTQPVIHGVIPEVNIYDFEPSELSAMSYYNGTNILYFFTPRERKYLKGNRPTRSTKLGHWNGVSKPSFYFFENGEILGRRNTLVYYMGVNSKRKEDKTNWIMHEYVLHESISQPRNPEDGSRLNDAVLCKIYHNIKEKKLTDGESSQRNQQLRNSSRNESAYVEQPVHNSELTQQPNESSAYGSYATLQTVHMPEPNQQFPNQQPNQTFFNGSNAVGPLIRMSEPNQQFLTKQLDDLSSYGLNAVLQPSHMSELNQQLFESSPYDRPNAVWQPSHVSGTNQQLESYPFNGLNIVGQTIQMLEQGQQILSQQPDESLFHGSNPIHIPEQYQQFLTHQPDESFLHGSNPIHISEPNQQFLTLQPDKLLLYGSNGPEPNEPSQPVNLPSNVFNTVGPSFGVLDEPNQQVINSSSRELIDARPRPSTSTEEIRDAGPSVRSSYHVSDQYFNYY